MSLPRTLGELKSQGYRARPVKDELRANLIEKLRGVGVDYEEITETLEKEGVQLFADSFDELLEVIRNKSRQVVRQP